MPLRRNILIFHLGALGDFIVTWPLAITLGRLFPQSRIYYVTHGQKGALADKVLRTEWSDVEGGWHNLYADPAALPEPAARLLAGAHTIVSFVADPDGRWADNVRAAAPEARLAMLSTAPAPEFDGHVIEHVLAQLKGWRAAETASRQILHSIAERGISYPRSAAGPVVIHPGAGSPAKCWPADRFIELCRRLRAGGRDVQFLMGEVERERWPADRLASLAAEFPVAQPETPLALLDHLSRASAFVGNDSGPGHLAGILGIPTVSIFGRASMPARWGPLGPRVRAVIGELDQVSVDDVLLGIDSAGKDKPDAA